MATGRAAPPVPRPARWTITDEEAAVRADMVYHFSGGGLLKNLNVGYDASDPNNEFTRTGLTAMVSRSPITGTYYVAFRGTEVSPIDRRDISTDLRQALGEQTPQHEAAIKLVLKIQKTLGPQANIHLVGHSLGGSLAAAAAYSTGLKATTFNPASLNRHYSQGSPGEIRSHVVIADILGVGRTLQNILFAFNHQPVGSAEPIVLPPLLTAPGTIILHAWRSPSPHSMRNFLGQ